MQAINLFTWTGGHLAYRIFKSTRKQLFLTFDSISLPILEALFLTEHSRDHSHPVDNLGRGPSETFPIMLPWTTEQLLFMLSFEIIMKMVLFIYLRWVRKFGGIWVIDSSEMKENAAVVRK